MPVHDTTEDEFHCLVFKLIDGECVEVSEEARRDGVAAATWRTHSRYQDDVHQVDLGRGVREGGREGGREEGRGREGGEGGRKGEREGTRRKGGREGG